MSRRSRTALANDAWEALFQAQTRLLRQFASQPVWNTLSLREYDVLYTLVRTGGGPVRLGDLAEQVYVPQPSLSRMIDRLDRRGLVARTKCAGDGRGVEVTVTEAGRKAQAEVGLVHGRHVAATMTSVLSDDDLAQLERIGTALTAAVDNQQGGSRP